ncbi:oxygenase MpaB family protein [Dyadobacter sp. 3J3]|uniref:oxygenase MpaB family protein n=1 Tax=Dyadobacter sp. 3J3 TaxID=2606600 RepID=UPI0013583638|nr:oxygenase MpaB family protein [Dyadobacter sp. 3J3]
MVDHKIYSDEILNRKRLLGDPPADDFIKIIFADPNKKLLLQNWMYSAGGNSDSESLTTIFPEFEFISKAQELPSWAEPELMSTGSALFARHSEMIMSLLGLLSLPYCYTAAHGAMVLYVSGRIQKQTTKRLYDTAIFVWDMMDPDAFVENGNAYQQILKVRIIHAAIRYYTLQSGKWDETWGLPVNQEDMAGTNLSFSLIVLRGLQMLGFKVSRLDQQAFLHTWAVIGYLTGLDEDMIPENQTEAKHLDAAIKRRQFRVSTHGKELTESLIGHILSVNTSKATPDDIMGLMRYLLGSEIADMLAIKAPELPAYKLALIRTFNLFKSFIPKGNLSQNYTNAYEAFRKLNPELVSSI